jgi:hypothetical protein
MLTIQIYNVNFGIYFMLMNFYSNILTKLNIPMELNLVLPSQSNSKCTT